MLFSANILDYPEKERRLRVHPRFTVPFLRLYAHEGEQLSGIQKFDSSLMLGTRKDGSTVKVQHYRWVCPDQSSFEMVMRCLPEDQYFWVELELPDACPVKT